MSFEEHKNRKLGRTPALRVMHYLGMIHWHECPYDGASQKLRRLHPLTWVWFILCYLGYSLAYGFVETTRDTYSVIKNETVWW